MTPSSTASAPAEPDLILIAELSEEAERHPPAIGARTLLVQHYLSIGWSEAASELARELQRVAPSDEEVLRLVEVVGKIPRSSTVVDSKTTPVTTRAVKPKRKVGPSKKMEDLVDGYRELRQKTRDLFAQLLHLQAEQKKIGLPKGGVSTRVRAIIEGEDGSEVESIGPPTKLGSLKRVVLSFPEKVVEVVSVDLEENCEWMRANGELDKDRLRDDSFRRLSALRTSLPSRLRPQCDLAWMHIERVHFTKPYANDTTMLLLEPLSTIPRETFFVTEDNWAWDLAELAQAITAQGGIMRNPMTGEMFTPTDIRGILAHPQGRHLAAIHVAQEKMFQGVRQETINRMEALAEIMEGEQGNMWKDSWEEIMGFQAYIATLPEREQNTINHYKCPVAFDDHARKAYDITVGQTLREVANATMCVHKGGDFLRQAAEHLKCRRGNEPDPQQVEENCVVM